jgi:hypothetical protein
MGQVEVHLTTKRAKVMSLSSGSYGVAVLSALELVSRGGSMLQYRLSIVKNTGKGVGLRLLRDWIWEMRVVCGSLVVV